MNAHFTEKPTPAEQQFADRVSTKARELVQEYAGEVMDSMQWPNRENVKNTQTRLLAYIAALEQKT